MGIERPSAVAIAEQVLSVTQAWRDYMAESEVSDSDMAILERCFAYQSVLAGFIDGGGSPRKPVRRM